MKTNVNCKYEVPATEICVSDCESVKTGTGSSGSILSVSSKEEFPLYTNA